jgi:Fe-S-cluster containining protein
MSERMSDTKTQGASEQSPCQACGACCAYSANWPRFTTEDDSALDLIPAALVNDGLSGMRCEGGVRDGAEEARTAGASLAVVPA